MSKKVGVLHVRSSLGGKVCTVQIVVYQDGAVTYTSQVQIGAALYQNGQSVKLFAENYTVSFVLAAGAYFNNWSTSGNLSVAKSYSRSTTLTVACGGTLTLNLTSLPASNYDAVVGTIWMPEPSSYDATGGNRIELREPYGSSPLGDVNGGSYDRRA